MATLANRIMKKALIFVVLCSISGKSFPCSFAAGYKPFLMAPSAYRQDKVPEPPKVSIQEIERGTKGDPGMCADAGILVLKIENYKRNIGYLFTIEEGEAEDRIFPDRYIVPVPGKKELRFVWLDGAYDFQEPINLKVKVVAASLSGAESQPSYIKIKHPGGSGSR